VVGWIRVADLSFLHRQPDVLLTAPLGLAGFYREVSMEYDRESIPEFDTIYLRQGLNLNDEKDILPDEIVEDYWRLKRLHDRIGARLDGSALAIICFLRGHGGPNRAELAPTGVAKMWHDKTLKSGDNVLVVWRKQQVEGIFKGLGNEGRVRVDINGTERTVPAETVSVPDLATA
jgi:hypothetical protein